MKRKVLAFFLTVMLVCASGCTGEAPQAVDTATPTLTPTVISSPSAALPDETSPTVESPVPDPVAKWSADFFAEDELYTVGFLSEAAASAVWKYGKELYWVDEYGVSMIPVTPWLLGTSKAAYQQALIYLCWYDPLSRIDSYDTPGEEKEALYAEIMFRGMKEDIFLDTDAFSDWTWGMNVFETAKAAQAIFSSASVDGDGGFVIVRFLYENDGAEYEDYYQVNWQVNEDAGADHPFPYQLAGVLPMPRYLLGGLPLGEFKEKYIGSASVEPLAALGITHEIDDLDHWGAWGTWGADSPIVIKALSWPSDEALVTYILVDDDGENVTYLRAFDEDAVDRGVPTRLLTVLQARNLLLAQNPDAELFYPGELDKWEDVVQCYGFMYADGDNYLFAWVNTITGEITFADEIDNYTGEEY